MTRHRWYVALSACLISAAFAAAQPVKAQTTGSNLTLCGEDPNPDVVIGSCTASIESGQISGATLGLAYNLRGEARYQQRQFTQALADFEQAVKYIPNRAAFHRNLAAARGALRLPGDTSLTIMTRQEASIADFNRAVQLDPKDPLNLIQRGNAFLALGRTERGLDDLNRAIEIDPNVAAAYEGRGVAAYALGYMPEAVANFTRALDLKPDFEEALLNRGQAYAAMEEYDRGIADLDEVLRRNPSNFAAYNARGISYARRGRTDRAIEDFDQALSLNPNFPDAYFNRGQAYFLKGNKDRSLSDYVQARQIDARFPEPPDGLFEDYDLDVVDYYRPRRPFRD